MSQPPTVQGRKPPGRWDYLQNWAVFVVLISVLPLILAFVIVLFTGRAITGPSILGKGELLIAALAVTADAAGSLHGKELHDRRLAVSNLCNLWTYIMVALVGLLIGRAFPTETEILAWGSLALFGISLLFSVTGKIIAKEKEHELDTN